MGTTSPTVGFALIARDEEDTLPRLLASIEGAFDQVALVDTGSTDRTGAVFTEWAEAERRRRPGFRATLTSFEWCDDFAAARNFAQEQLDTDWSVWADADDEIRGAAALRDVASGAAEDVNGFRAVYTCNRSVSGERLHYTNRIRLYRTGLGTWENRVHEKLVVPGEIGEIAEPVTEWIHVPKAGESERSSTRNLAILRRWVEEEPDSTFARLRLGMEEALWRRHELALEQYEAALALAEPKDAPSIRLLASRSLMALRRFDEALDEAATALRERPSSPDAHLAVAEIHLVAGRPQEAIRFAEASVGIDDPDVGPLFSPVDRVMRPRMLIALAQRSMGDDERSVATATLALDGLLPDR